jgi:hypothetical protein
MGVERSIADDKGKSRVNPVEYVLGMICVEQVPKRHLWVYVGSRKTRTGTINRVFCRMIDSPGVHWPYCLWTYIASNDETIRKKFHIQ